MTETEWLTATDPMQMMAALTLERGRATGKTAAVRRGVLSGDDCRGERAVSSEAVERQ